MKAFEAEYVLAEDKVMVFQTDLQERITSANHYFAEASGYGELELIGAPHQGLHHPDLPRGVMRDLASTLQAGLAWMGLLKCRRKNGGYFWVRASATPLREEGALVAYLWLCSKPAPITMVRAAA